MITASDLLKTMGNFAGADEIGGLIVLEMERTHFAISEISRIVESNDCTILHLNTTTNPVNGLPPSPSISIKDRHRGGHL